MKYSTSSLMLRQYGVLLIRILLGVVFLWSGVPKILQPYHFFINIGGYSLVSPSIAMWIAIVVPWFELILGLCLLSNLGLGGALLSSTLLCTIFVLANSSVLYRGISTSCGCFGGDDVVGPWSLIRAILVCVIAGIGYGLNILNTSQRTHPVSSQGSSELQIEKVEGRVA